jgi:hypothetical protein
MTRTICLVAALASDWAEVESAPSEQEQYGAHPVSSAASVSVSGSGQTRPARAARFR